MNAAEPEIHKSRKDPPKAKGQIKADRQKDRKQRKSVEYGGAARRSVSSCSVAWFALISSCNTERYIRCTLCKAPRDNLPPHFMK